MRQQMPDGAVSAMYIGEAVEAIRVPTSPRMRKTAKNEKAPAGVAPGTSDSTAEGKVGSATSRPVAEYPGDGHSEYVSEEGGPLSATHAGTYLGKDNSNDD